MTGLACGNSPHRLLSSRSQLLNAFFAALIFSSYALSIVAQHIQSVDDAKRVDGMEALLDGPIYLQYMQARILCMAECERLVYISNGIFPTSLLVRLHIFSNLSSALELNRDAATERCVLDVIVRNNGVLLTKHEFQVPPLYQIFETRMMFEGAAEFQSRDAKLQTFLFDFVIEISSWKCARHSVKVVPATPVPIGSRSAALRWAPSLLPDGADAMYDAATPAHSYENHQDFSTDSALMISWMMSLQRRPERWQWGRASAARAGLDVARWLVVDGRREDARSCIDSVTAFARGLDVRSIQPYTALSAALSHKLLHVAIAQYGARAGLNASIQPFAGREHGPGMNSSLSCDVLLAPVNLTRSADTDADWIVIVEDDLLPNVTAADVQLVMRSIPLDFDLIWLGHCPCIWNGPAALSSEIYPVVSVSISQDRVVQLWRGFASCLHAYAVNPSSTHVTSALINLFDGVQWRSACESAFLRCLVAVVVPSDSAAHVRSINGLPGMFDQNKELVSEIHKAPL
jgi:hypothetical protein